MTPLNLTLSHVTIAPPTHPYPLSLEQPSIPLIHLPVYPLTLVLTLSLTYTLPHHNTPSYTLAPSQ